MVWTEVGELHVAKGVLADAQSDDFLRLVLDNGRVLMIAKRCVLKVEEALL